MIYIVLGILYESFIHPLTILSGLPSAGFGALLTLLLFGTELNIYAFVGLIMLIGIVKKNAIMQIDFALDAQRNEGKSRARGDLRGLPHPLPADHDDHHGGAAGHAADRARLRRRRRGAAAAGLAVVGGLLFSQLVTLYLTPVYYTYLEAVRAERPHAAPALAWSGGGGRDGLSGGHMKRWYLAWVGAALLGAAMRGGCGRRGGSVSPQEAAQVVAVTDLSVQDGTVSASLVNKSPRLVRDVHLLIRHAWVWNDERHPGADSPGTARVLHRPQHDSAGTKPAHHANSVAAAAAAQRRPLRDVGGSGALRRGRRAGRGRRLTDVSFPRLQPAGPKR